MKFEAKRKTKDAYRTKKIMKLEMHFTVPPNTTIVVSAIKMFAGIF